VLHRSTGALEDRIFCDLLDYLHPGDLLVANETRVLESGYLYYDWPKVVEIIRELSPETVVWSSSLPDARWCGNERGVIAETMW